MPALYPGSDAPALASRLSQAHRGLAVCFCAAWCDTCRSYQHKFDAMAQRHSDWVFVWADIEEHPELLGDEDVENFPTLLLSIDGSARFFGPMLPHIDHLNRLLDAVDAQTPGVATALPPDLAGLLAKQQSAGLRF